MLICHLHPSMSTKYTHFSVGDVLSMKCLEHLNSLHWRKSAFGVSNETFKGKTSNRISLFFTQEKVDVSDVLQGSRRNSFSFLGSEFFVILSPLFRSSFTRFRLSIPFFVFFQTSSGFSLLSSLPVCPLFAHETQGISLVSASHPLLHFLLSLIRCLFVDRKQ
jgi:hypothetical protein